MRSGRRHPHSAGLRRPPSCAASTKGVATRHANGLGLGLGLTNQPLRALFLLFLEELQPLHHVRDARALPAYMYVRSGYVEERIAA